MTRLARHEAQVEGAASFDFVRLYEPHSALDAFFDYTRRFGLSEV
jgi:hypothetical protein